MKRIKYFAMIICLTFFMTACGKKEAEQTTTTSATNPETTAVGTQKTTVNVHETTETETQKVTTKSAEKRNVSGEIAGGGYLNEDEYWRIDTDDGKVIGVFLASDTKYTWEKELEEDAPNKSYILTAAEKVDLVIVPKNDLSEEKKEELDEDVEAWYVAESVHVTEINEYAGEMTMKPVIYLYPETTTEVNVQLCYNGILTTTYPAYKAGGWNVVAEPDGTLTDKETKREYSYLFWEGNDHIDYDMSEGFVVAGKDTAEFLQKKLAYLGLTPREYNEFIVFWLPKMQNNKYNLIKFQGTDYTKNAKLTIAPEPDSVLRVFMTWKALDEKIEVKEQKLSTFERKGFTVVEWGGSEITE